MTILSCIVQYLIVPNNIISILGNLASDLHFESFLVKEISNNFNRYYTILNIGGYWSIFDNIL